MTNEKKEEEDGEFEIFVGSYKPTLSEGRIYNMSNGKKERIIESYQPKDTDKEDFSKRSYAPQSSGEQPKPEPPKGGTGAQKPKK